MCFEVVAHHVPHTTVPANRPHRPVSAPPKRSPPAETGQPVRTPYGVRGRRLARRQTALRPAIRPPVAASPPGERVDFVRFSTSWGDGELIGGRVFRYQPMAICREGGRVEWRPSSGSSSAVRVQGRAGKRARGQAICASSRGFWTAPCEQADGQVGRHANRQPGGQAACRLALLPVLPTVIQAGWPPVKRVNWQRVFHADRQTCKQATRRKGRLFGLFERTGKCPGGAACG